MKNEEIIQRGILIRDETEPAQNTSQRVGGVIEGIGRNLAEKDAAIAAEAARNGYYQCTVNSNQLAVTAPGFTLPAHGGNIRIKMSAPATGASTLNINSTGPKTLLYNGAALSSANTWEQNEIISVFYDPSGSGQYLASNSQGGGGKAEKIRYDNSASGLDAENVQGALDEINRNTFADGGEILPVQYTEGYYISASGELTSGSSWKASEFLNIDAVSAGDTFVWSSISKLLAACIAFYDEDGTLMQAFSATGSSRTITIANDAAAIGATKVRASFLINGAPLLTHNGVDVLSNNKHYNT